MYFSKDLRDFTWESIITEMKERVPDVHATIAVPKVKDAWPTTHCPTVYSICYTYVYKVERTQPHAEAQ